MSSTGADITVACVMASHPRVYELADVVCLRDALARYAQFRYEFVCLTAREHLAAKGVRFIRPEPLELQGSWCKLALFDDRALTGRVLALNMACEFDHAFALEEGAFLVPRPRAPRLYDMYAMLFDVSAETAEIYRTSSRARRTPWGVERHIAETMGEDIAYFRSPPCSYPETLRSRLPRMCL